VVKKLSRTISGVTPVAVMARPGPCPGSCVFCPTYPEAPKSYTPESPAVLRALACGYDAGKQVELRLKVLSNMGHHADKIELIIMGGTFPACPPDYQRSFIKGCYDALNGCDSADLEQAKIINQTATHRCVGLCIETRPDWCSEADVRRMLEFGATRVELGVQTLDDDIYRTVRRGHTVNEVIAATSLLKRYGLKVYYHWMPGLPGSSMGHDLEMSDMLFNNPDLRPDGLKLYPTLVVKGTQLEKWYEEGRYQPRSMEQTVELMVGIKRLVPEYVRIPRVMRDIPTRFIVAGCKDLALRSSVRQAMKAGGYECRCIRCREYGHRLRDGYKPGKPLLRRLDYEASDGHEIFLSFNDENDTLFGLLRLRIGAHDIFPATVREIHVFGPEVPLGLRDGTAAQHQGLGLQLLKEAERIASEEFVASKIAVISGVGAREYFRTECGYSLEGHYMVKALPAAKGKGGRQQSDREHAA